MRSSRCARARKQRGPCGVQNAETGRAVEKNRSRAVTADGRSFAFGPHGTLLHTELGPTSVVLSDLAIPGEVVWQGHTFVDAGPCRMLLLLLHRQGRNHLRPASLANSVRGLGFWYPGLPALAEQVCTECLVCATIEPSSARNFTCP